MEEQMRQQLEEKVRQELKPRILKDASVTWKKQTVANNKHMPFMTPRMYTNQLWY